MGCTYILCNLRSNLKTYVYVQLISIILFPFVELCLWRRLNTFGVCFKTKWSGWKKNSVKKGKSYGVLNIYVSVPLIHQSKHHSKIVHINLFPLMDIWRIKTRYKCKILSQGTGFLGSNWILVPKRRFSRMQWKLIFLVFLMLICAYQSVLHNLLFIIIFIMSKNLVLMIFNS